MRDLNFITPIFVIVRFHRQSFSRGAASVGGLVASLHLPQSDLLVVKLLPRLNVIVQLLPCLGIISWADITEFQIRVHNYDRLNSATRH